MAGATSGAVAAGLIGALVGLGIPESDARFYEGEVKSGRTLVTVRSPTRPAEVAEILRSEVPLLRDLGLAAEWQLITGDDAFFSVTKAIHNGLQGASRDLSPLERETYLANATRNAHLLDGTYDLVVVHDPQPLAIRQFHGNGDARWIWRCHALGAEDDSPTLDIVRAATTRLRAALTGRDTARF